MFPPELRVISGYLSLVNLVLPLTHSSLLSQAPLYTYTTTHTHTHTHYGSHTHSLLATSNTHLSPGRVCVETDCETVTHTT